MSIPSEQTLWQMGISADEWLKEHDTKIRADEWLKEHDTKIRAEVIEEIKKKVHPCDNCNMCKTQEEFEYNYEACVYDEEVKLTKIFEILEQLKEQKK